MRVAFRVDASPMIGGGHAMRCLTLANALGERGADVTFVTSVMPERLEQRICEGGHRLVRVSPSPELERSGQNWEEPPFSGQAQSEDAAESELAIGQCDWLVVDHYLLSAAWHSRARRFARRLLVIDDLANRPYDCDLLLDQTLGRTAKDYAARVQPEAMLLLGSAFALLRPEFSRERPTALERRTESTEVRRVLVSLGTTDASGLTHQILEALASANSEIAVDLVVGAQTESVPKDDDANVRIHVDTDRMAELMRDADLAVGAAGTTSWERCCLGLPAIVTVLAENQRRIADALAAAGAQLNVDARDRDALDGALRRLLRSREARLSLSEMASRITDGRGTQRVLEAMAA